MTKKELIIELHRDGCFWANETYTKAYLERHLEELKEAKTMSLSELMEKIGLTTEEK